MKLFPTCFNTPQNKQLLILTAIWTLAMVMATFIAIGASADDTSPDGLATLILTVGMFAVRYMATQRGWKAAGKLPTPRARRASPRHFP